MPAAMRYEIIFSAEAVQDFQQLKANVRAHVRDALEQHLRYEPTKQSRSRIKRLRGVKHPQYRLRIDDIRVFYDVGKATVEILAIIPKSEADEWLAHKGVYDETGSSFGSKE